MIGRTGFFQRYDMQFKKNYFSVGFAILIIVFEGRWYDKKTSAAEIEGKSFR